MNCPTCRKPLTDLGDGEHWCSECRTIIIPYYDDDGMLEFTTPEKHDEVFGSDSATMDF